MGGPATTPALGCARELGLPLLAGIQLIDSAAVSRYGFDRIAVIILSYVGIGVAFLCAGLGMMRGRRWAWIIGVVVGLLDVYAGVVFLQAWLSEFDHGRLFVPLILTGGVGVTIVVCLFTRAAIRFFWGRTTGKRPHAAPMIPST